MTFFGPDVCGNLESALSREWIETNGLGGFASSTIAGLNTRRYHGLLVAALKPPVGRMVLVSKLEETLFVGERRVGLSSNEYPGVIHPDGYRFLKQFRLDPFPVFTYEVEGIEIRKTVFMPHGENTTVVQYETDATPEQRRRLRLEIRPLVAFRDYHGTTRENSALRPALRVRPGLVLLTPYADQPTLYVAHDAGEVNTAGGWYRNFKYRLERERGLDDEEDLYNPFGLMADFGEASRVAVIVSTSPQEADNAETLRQAEVRRREALLESTPSAASSTTPGTTPGATTVATPVATPINDPLVRSLTLAADQYIVSRGDRHSIIAGYPWFSDWGRDAMISLPGLTLATGRHEVARSILEAFAQHVDQGMLPNRFPDSDEQPEYNTVDATLWYFEAIRAWVSSTGDYHTVRQRWYGLLAGIIAWHEKGTRHGIRLEEDGLLHSGEPGAQLTWMDAKVGDWVFTPRQGKAVEIQALWYNALRIMEDLARRFGNGADERRFAELAHRTRASFNQKFWNPSAQCLYDVLGDDGPDGSLRPNQILAVSLPYSMVEAGQSRQVVATVRRELLTPLGLRTLPRGDSRYVPRYEGGVWSRDGAYHQGTVWPWLMGPFLEAYLKVNEYSDEARRQAGEWLAPFLQHLDEAGLGHISEIADAEPPHTPRGCFAQAWSVAELLRAATLIHKSGFLENVPGGDQGAGQNCVLESP